MFKLTMLGADIGEAARAFRARLQIVLPAEDHVSVLVDGHALDRAPTEALVVAQARDVAIRGALDALGLEVSTCDLEEAARMAAICDQASDRRRLPLDRSLRLLRDFLAASPASVLDRPEAAHAWASLTLHAIEHAPVPWPRALQLAVSHIDTNFAAPLSIDDLASRCAVGRRTLHNLFRRHLGMSPYAFVSRRRIERAIDMLVGEPDLSIAAIAHATGHRDQSTLTRIMRSRLNITPAAYRRQHRDVGSPGRPRRIAEAGKTSYVCDYKEY
ncbi:helix-turn-helix domain-containing protein [Salinarimonas sp.]|uniref:AraC family transcriptional regulator n=1 Tax=Salinarimonas sp. TaxID=2766526 RepID=UPI00391A9D27